MTKTGEVLVRVRSLRKQFAALDVVVVAADGIDLDVMPGTVTAVTGPSGSGKSTLLHLIGALDRPDGGSIEVEGVDVTRLRGRRAAAYRRSIGFVFQRFNLLPTLSVLDNVLAPVIPTGVGREHRERAADLLESVGLAGRERTIATRLSGGQQQRVAIARALIFEPRLVLADEPTGNLDSTTAGDIEDLLFALRERHGATVLIATHDPGLAGRCDRIVSVRDGQVLAEDPLRP